MTAAEETEWLAYFDLLDSVTRLEGSGVSADAAARAVLSPPRVVPE
jgi:hypothetical protein